jgi:tRNA pseudouridine55 synthase
MNTDKLKSLNGILLVNKPAGPTSTEVVQKIRRISQVKKIGHAGTLDPAAMGLLVVLMGSATRLQDVFLGSKKSYRGIIRLGLGTTTDDLEGVVVAEASAEEKLKELFQKKEEGASFEEFLLKTATNLETRFSGTFEQLPPIFSAKRVEGKRSYDLARAGEEVPRKPSKVTVTSIALKFLSAEKLSYEIQCSSGFYIRSLARDIGSILHLPACAEKIERTHVPPFDIEQTTPFEDFLHPENGESAVEEKMLTLGQALAHLPSYNLSEEEMKLLSHGSQYFLQKIPVTKDDPKWLIPLYKDEPQGLFEKSDGEWKIRAVL